MSKDINSIPMKSIQIYNFTLRQIIVEDYNDMFEYYSQDKVVKYLPIKKHRSPNDTKRFINTYFINKYKKGYMSHYAIVDNDTNRVIGNVGFNEITPLSTSGELGICINPKYWGDDLSTKLVTYFLDMGFNELKLETITAVIFTGNKYSKSPLDKLDFKHLRTYTKTFHSLNNKEIICQEYILCREDYLSRKQLIKKQSKKKSKKRIPKFKSLKNKLFKDNNY